MTRHRLSVRGLLLVFSSLAAIGFFIPGSPAYLLPLWRHYSTSYAGHTLGYWVRAVDAADDELRLKAIMALGSIGAGRCRVRAVLGSDLDGR